MAGLINYTPTNDPQAMNNVLKPDPTPDQDQSVSGTQQDVAQGQKFDMMSHPNAAIGSISAPPVQNAQAERATATNWNVDPTTQTVASQVQGLIQRGSPLMELSKTQAEQQMTARGLQNSSMGITAGQNAVYQAALPIASQDASTYAKAGEFNAGAANAASNLNAQLGTNVNLSNAGAANTAANLGAQLTSAQRLQQIQSDTSLSVADKQAATQKYVNDQNTETQKWLQQSDAALKTAMQNTDVNSRAALQESANASSKDLANIQADYQTLIRTDASASQAIATAAQERLAIMTDKTMSAEGRINSLNMINNQLKAALNLHGSINGVDLTSLLDTFGGDTTVIKTPPPANLTPDTIGQYMKQNNFSQNDAGGYLAAIQKYNTENPGNPISTNDIGKAYGMTPAQTDAWMKAHPGK